MTNLNKKYLTEVVRDRWLATKIFWDMAKNNEISYKHFYETFFKEIKENGLSNIFETFTHKLKNKGTYGKIKEYCEQHPDDYFGKALIKLWVLQFKDNAKDIDAEEKEKQKQAEEERKKRAEIERKAREEEQAKNKAIAKEILDRIIAKDSEIEAQCFEAAQEAVKNKDVIKLAKLATFCVTTDKQSYRNKGTDFNLADLSLWKYKSEWYSDTVWKSSFIFNSWYVEFYTLDDSGNSKGNDLRPVFLNESFHITGTGYEINELEKFEAKIDNKQLKEYVLARILSFVQKSLPYYEKEEVRIKAKLQKEKEKDDAKNNLITLIKHSGKYFTDEQLVKINDLFKKLLAKFTKRISSEANSWADNDYDGNAGAAYDMEIFSAFRELEPILGEFYWVAYDENGKLISEFDPAIDKTKNNDGINEKLKDAIYAVLKAKSVNFKFAKN